MSCAPLHALHRAKHAMERLGLFVLFRILSTFRTVSTYGEETSILGLSICQPVVCWIRVPVNTTHLT